MGGARVGHINSVVSTEMNYCVARDELLCRQWEFVQHHV